MVQHIVFSKGGCHNRSLSHVSLFTGDFDMHHISNWQDLCSLPLNMGNLVITMEGTPGDVQVYFKERQYCLSFRMFTLRPKLSGSKEDQDL